MIDFEVHSTLPHALQGRQVTGTNKFMGVALVSESASVSTFINNLAHERVLHGDAGELDKRPGASNTLLSEGAKVP